MHRTHAAWLAAAGAALALVSARVAADAKVAAADAETARRAQVVAKFEGGTITLGELEDAIVRQSPFMRKRYLEAPARKDLLDRLVRFELLALEAERRGYGANPTVVQSLKETMVQRLLEQEVDDVVNDASIPAEDVARHYEQNRAEFVRPAMRRAAHVLVGTEEAAKAMLAKARDADLREFRELARRESIDEASNVRGGDLGYFDVEGVVAGADAASLPAPIAKAAFALAHVGDVVPDPIRIEGGFSILKLTGERAASERSLAAAEPTIRARLARDRRREASQAFIEKLQVEHPPVVRGELLELVK